MQRRRRGTDRGRIVQVRVSDEELETLHALAVANDENVSQLLRRLAREEKARRDGELGAAAR